jgi:hypothetical protein
MKNTPPLFKDGLVVNDLQRIKHIKALGSFHIVQNARINKMPPLLKLTRREDGKVELTQLKATKSVQVCVEFNGRLSEAAYFEDKDTQQRFNVLSVDDVVSVNIGLFNGEGWYRWVWIWESTQEADEAWNRAPADIEKVIEELTQKINNFIVDAARIPKPDKSRVVLDITPELMNIGWEMTILDYTADEVEKEYRLSKKVHEKKKE